MFLLLLLRLFVLACTFYFAKYDTDNRTFYIFVFVGLNGGGLVAYWDEIVLSYTAFPLTITTIATFVLCVFCGGVLYAIRTQTKNNQEEP